MQLALFDSRSSMAIDTRYGALVRRALDDRAWLDYAPQWLAGQADLLRSLHTSVRWRMTTQQLFEQTVQTPRQVATFPADGDPPEVVHSMAAALSARYGVRFDRTSAACYRSGRDSVAWHRDREYRDRATSVVAIVSVGAPRPFLVRPYRSFDPDRPPSARPRRSVAYRLGWGDLLVMGGTAQRDWEHAVPKVAHADPRISIMFRHDPDQPPAPPAPAPLPSAPWPPRDVEARAPTPL